MTFLPSISIAALLLMVPVPALAADAPPQAEGQSGAAPASPLATQPLDQLSATRERPLFSPTRRPVPTPIAHVPEAPPPPPPPPPPNVALFGIVMDGDEARAIVRTGPAEKMIRVRIGDDIGGWTVGQIDGRKLVLSLDGRVAVFTMFSGDSAVAAPNSGPVSQLPDKKIQNQTPQNQLRQNEAAPTGQGSSSPRKPHRQR